MSNRYTYDDYYDTGEKFSSAHIDYSKKSKYFKSDNDVIKELTQIEKQKKYVVWVQEFSKKIVIIVFMMFVIFSFAELGLIYMSFKEGYSAGLDTLITETHLTFRDVVGGYLIKAGVENAFKIGGNYFVGISEAKLQMLKEELQARGFVKNEVPTSQSTQNDSYNEPVADGELDADFEMFNYINPNRYE